MQLPVLVFDGDCAFCTTAVDRMRRMLPAFPEAQPWQWLDLPALGLTPADGERAVWMVTARGRWAGHLAVSVLLRGQPTPGWRFLGHLIATPPFSWLAAVGYRWVAHNRHRLPGGTPACSLPPEQRPGATQ